MEMSAVDQYRIQTAEKMAAVDASDHEAILGLYAELLGNANDPIIHTVRRYPEAALTGLLQHRVRDLLDIIEQQREEIAELRGQIGNQEDIMFGLASKLAAHDA